MTTLFALALSLSLMTVTGFFCFVLFRLAQHIENLTPQRRIARPQTTAQFVTQQGFTTPPSAPTRKCNKCEEMYQGNMCPECGTVPAPEPARRRFQGFGSIKRKIEEAG